MKKNTVKVMLLMALLGGSVSLFAQKAEFRQRIIENSHVEAGRKLTARLDAEFKEKHAEAMRLAEINNWPLVRERNGQTGYLMYVSEEGTPIYLETDNLGSAITSRANYLQPGGGLNLNLTGNGGIVGQMFVGMWDGEYPRTTHQDFANRISTADISIPNPIELHPTHVMGTMIGSGATDAAARGIAYQAFGVASNFDNDLAEMGQQNEFVGMILSNHSYGYPPGAQPTGTYISYSSDVDELLFYYPYYQPVFSAGNSGNGNYDRLTTYAVAKNTIVVANVAEVNTFNADGTPTSVSIAGSSSWGPTHDNRIKPDISSKGQDVYSTTNVSNTSHGNLSGTSMAAPGVTGALVLLQQYYGNLHEGTFMKSATVRGLLAHTADDCGNTGPDPVFGWGLMNSKKFAETITNEGVSSTIDELVLLPGQTYTVNVLAIGNQPLVATLAWTDPAGTPVNSNSTSPRLVNNLDIVVTKNNVNNYPWRLASSNSAAAIKAENNVDNIEKVEVAEASGTYTITISHKGSTLVNPDGDAQQEYSLIVTGVNVTGGVESPLAELFSVWPNPAASVLNIRLSSGFEAGAAVKLIDMQGRVMQQQALAGAETVINVEGLATGVYFAEVQNGGKTQIKKIVIE